MAIGKWADSLAQNRKLRSFILHTVLTVSSIFFALPFFWLLSSSCKTPTEMLPVRWLPQFPLAVLESPYIALRDNDQPVRPASISENEWLRLRPIIDAAIQSRIQAIQGSLAPFLAPAIGSQELVDGILLRLLRRAPEEFHLQDEKSIGDWFASGVQPSIIEEAFEAIYCRTAFSDVVFRGLDATVEERVPADQCGWRIVSGSAVIEAVPSRHGHIEYQARYDFNGSASFQAQAVVPVSLPLEEIDKVLVSYHADRSWHEVFSRIEMNGKSFLALQPAYLGTDYWQETAWRFRKEDPAALNMRTWIWLKEEAGGSDFNQPGKARITLTVAYGSLWKASWNKLIDNYRNVLRMIPLAAYVKNSLILVVLNIIGQALASSLVAYAFSRLFWPGREFCFMLMLATLMIPFQVTLIPQFLIFKTLGWYNTLLPLWVGAFFGSPFYIFLLRQFMRGIPADLEDSAKIDGSGYFGIYWNIILPLVKPALAAIGIFTFLGTWNDFMGPLIYLNDQRLYPLSMGVFALQVFQVGNFGLMLAASVLMIVPVILLFFLAQRHFIQGITLTGMKG